MAKNRSTDNQNSILLSTPEFWLLLSQFAPALVLGVENPYTGWLAEEIKNANRDAVDSLMKRGWARPLTEETVDVNDDLLALSKVCAHPSHSFVLQISNRNGQNERRYFNFSDDLIVEHYEVNSGEHFLCKYLSRPALVDHVFDLLNLQVVPQVKGKGFQLPESTLFKATELAVLGNTEEVDGILSEAGLGKPEGAALRNALVTPVVNASIAVIANQGDPETQHVRGFGILQSNADLWVMSPFEKLGESLVEFSPASVEDIHVRLEEAIPGCQPIGGE